MDALSHLLEPGLLIPVCAILMPLGMAAIALNFVYRWQERKHKTVVDLLEKGLPVPRELLGGTPSRAGSPLMRAMTMIGIGLGLCAFLGAMFGLSFGLWASGLIPLCIGVAQLIALKLEPQRPPEPEVPSSIDLQ